MPYFTSTGIVFDCMKNWKAMVFICAIAFLIILIYHAYIISGEREEKP